MRLSICRIAAVFTLVPMAHMFAQEPNDATTSVPRLLRVTGTYHPANGLPVGTTESATLSIYRDQEGGQPLWQETQNVPIDTNGQYTAMLGATQKEGVPVDLFSATEPRWLGIMFNRPGETEQSRIQLVSVPYALKASDAETLGGKPASAYLLAPSSENIGQPTAASGASTSTALNPKAAKPRGITGTPTTNSIVKFTDTSGDLGNSILTDNGTGRVGVGITNPAYTLDVGGPVGIDTTWARLFLKSGITSAAVSLSQDGGGNGILDTGANAGQLILSTQGTSRVNITQGGTIGIGDSGPLGKLGVATTSDTTPSALGVWDTRHFVVGGPGNSGGIGISYNQTSDAAYIQTAKPNVGYGATVLQPFGGNVGIGVLTPGSPLSVAGDINFSGVMRFLGVPVQRYSLTSNNTSSGVSALANADLTGTNNTAVGSLALTGNTAGSSNTGVGYFALKSNTGGNENTAVGAQSLENTVGDSNIGIGLGAGSSITTGSNNIEIGSTGTTSDSHVIRIGTSSNQTSFYAAGVSNVNLTNDQNGLVVLIDKNTGQLGISGTSSRRYKEDIQDMGDASSGLMRLRPVTFRYKQPTNDGSKPIEYGLIAEEVAEVYPNLVVHSADGQIEGVRYQVLDPMLLNEVQKQERRIGQQGEQIQKLEEQNRSLQERLEKLEAAIEAGSH